MEDFLKKLKLLKEISISLNTQRSEFVPALKKYVDSAKINNPFSRLEDIFTSSKNSYKGIVTSRDFEIKKRLRFGDSKFSGAKITGTFQDFGDTLIIKAKVNAWNNFMFFFYGFVIIFYFVFGILMVPEIINSGEDFFSVIIIPFLFIHAFFMLGMPYFFMRRSVLRTLREFEKEIHFIQSKEVNNKL